MSKYALMAVLAMTALPASAKDLTITLTDQEQQQLFAILDLAAKQGGVQASVAIAYFVQKLRPPPVTQGPSSQPQPVKPGEEK
jgi:hypothetical protein